MGANAPLIAVAVGSVLFLICVRAVVVLCREALQCKRKFKAKIKVLSMTFELRVK